MTRRLSVFVGCLAIAFCAARPALAQTYNTTMSPRAVEVETTTSLQPNGRWLYEYTVYNETVRPGGGYTDWPSIITYQIPVPASWESWIFDIQNPDPAASYRWYHRVLTPAEYQQVYGMASPFRGDHAILDWYDMEPVNQVQISPAGNPYGNPDHIPDTAMYTPDDPSSPYFSFESPLPPTYGPFANIWHDWEQTVGDPPITGEFNSPDFSKIPEPATLSLLALGALGALCRRRRK